MQYEFLEQDIADAAIEMGEFHGFDHLLMNEVLRHRVAGLNITETVKATGLSRSTVSKYIKILRLLRPAEHLWLVMSALRVPGYGLLSYTPGDLSGRDQVTCG